ncbi:MAG: PQQ-dependent sugar dehydrogenase, partial [Saprospiraceae bacterium]|nr:PQQ-dependent sugar dehydrogenase [Saprospiraceae bacterium]
PNLAGVTREVSVEGIKKFIRNSQEVIDGGDQRAKELFAKFHVYMPPFGMYTEDQLDAIVAYLHTFEKSDEEKTTDAAAIENPIAQPIESSGIVVPMKLFTEIPFSSEEMPRTRIVKMVPLPGSDRLFVADLRGQLYEIIKQKPVLVLDLNKIFPNFIHKPGLATGFGSFAFHPDFVNNGLLYITHSEPPKTAPADFAYADSIKVTLQWVLSECTVKNPTASVFEVAERELLRINMVTGIHGMQDIEFRPNITPADPDYGKLYVNIGDGGSAENGYTFIADNPGTAWSAILRIDPAGRNSKNGKYGIPSDNPFVNAAAALPEVYAYGFRNPHRTIWDQKGRMFTTGIGHHQIEELNLILPGRNYGWPYREGTFVLNPLQDMNSVLPLPEKDEREYTYPVAQFDHDEGNAISGGYEVTTSSLPQLQGKFLFGDIVSGRLFFINMDEIELGKQAPVYEWKIELDGVPTDLVTVTGSKRVDLRFGIDSKNNIYILTKADGKIYKLTDHPL